MRYTAGKADWFASGLPLEGSEAARPRAADAARRSVPTCDLSDPVDEVRERIRQAQEEACIVVDADRVVLGRVASIAPGEDGARTVEDVMDPAPSTIRPNVPLDELIERLERRRSGSILVTTSDGQLVGVLHRSDAERRLHEAHARRQTNGQGGGRRPAGSGRKTG